MFDLGPRPSRFLADAATVRRLVAAQLPAWADLPVRPVATQGWDNQTFRLGEEMLVRLPSAAEYALAVDKEHTWLPELARQVPLPIPVPLVKGLPGEGYPHHWSIYQWIDGVPAAADSIEDQTAFAADLAEFVLALQRVDPAGGPGPGTHNWFRGGPLTTYAEITSDALETLREHLDIALAQDIWQCALDASWDGHPVWFHGDLAPGNILLRDGTLAAVIDFGTCGVGDPACDLAIAWTLLSNESRQIFRDVLAVDPGTWTRGRGWALWKTLADCASAVREGSACPPREIHVLDQIITEYQRSRQ